MNKKKFQLLMQKYVKKHLHIHANFNQVEKEGYQDAEQQNTIMKEILLLTILQGENTNNKLKLSREKNLTCVHVQQC